MLNQLIDQAVKAALNQNWPEAIDLNHKILEISPEHTSTLNRLARAYAECGETEKAVDCYKKCLEIDRFNIIAKKNVHSLQNVNKSKTTSKIEININFIEEPGRTKTTQLIRLGDPKVIASLRSGQVVHLVPKNHWISITTAENVYVGAIADDLSFKLKHLLTNGNDFQVTVKSISGQSVQVFIKDTCRNDNTPCFN